jgi:chromosome segregation ATPase
MSQSDLEKENEKLTAHVATLRSELRSKIEDMARLDSVLTKVRTEALEVKDELAEINRIFELQRKRTHEADELWRAAHPGKENVRPDLGDLINWLMKEREKYMLEATDAKKRMWEVGHENDRLRALTKKK